MADIPGAEVHTWAEKCSQVLGRLLVVRQSPPQCGFHNDGRGVHDDRGDRDGHDVHAALPLSQLLLELLGSLQDRADKQQEGTVREVHRSQGELNLEDRDFLQADRKQGDSLLVEEDSLLAGEDSLLAEEDNLQAEQGDRQIELLDMWDNRQWQPFLPPVL